MKHILKRTICLMLVLALTCVPMADAVYAASDTASTDDDTTWLTELLSEAEDTTDEEEEDQTSLESETETQEEEEEAEEEVVTYTITTTVDDDGNVIDSSTETTSGEDTQTETDDTTAETAQAEAADTEEAAEAEAAADAAAAADTDTAAQTEGTADSEDDAQEASTQAEEAGTEASENTEDAEDAEDAADAETVSQTASSSSVVVKGIVSNAAVTASSSGTTSSEEDADSTNTVNTNTESVQYSVLSTSSSKTQTGTSTTYSLEITVKTTAVSSSDTAIKTISISVPELTTTVTASYSDGTTAVISTQTKTYTLTVECHVMNVGREYAALNSAGDAYVYTASNTSSGNYIQAIRITPSDSLKTAMNTAGLTFCYRAVTEGFGTLGWANVGQLAGTSGNQCALTGLELEVFTKTEAAALDTTDRFLGGTSVQYKTKTTGSSSWSSVKEDGETAGKASESSSIGVISISTEALDSTYSVSGGISYSVRSTKSDASIRWSDYVSDGTAAGSTDDGLQAIKIKLTGDLANYYDVYYRVYVGEFGWLGWAKNGEKAGTKQTDIEIGAIQIVIVPKGEDAPGDTENHFISVTKETTYKLKITVKTTAVSDSDATVKKITVSKPKLTKTVTTTYSNGKTESTSSTSTYALTVECNVLGSGWKTASVTSSGTSYSYTASKASSGKYIQAVRITPSSKLKTAMAKAGITFYYRATTEYFGTLGWAKAGLTAGTTGNNCALTGLELKVVTTSAASSLDTTYRYIAKTSIQYKSRATGASSWSSAVKNGSTSGTKSITASLGSLAVRTVQSSTGFAVSGDITYNVRTSSSNDSENWSGYKTDYTTAGSKNAGIQAIKIKLTGDLAEYYDIYYRVYVGNYGWLGWAKNGQKAGTESIGLTVGAVQIKLVPKGADAPGSTSKHYINSISGDSTLDGYLYEIYAEYGTDLETLFKYVGTYTYIRTSDTLTGSWKTWSIEFAKQMYENQGGNCYRYASLFCWLGRGLGYNLRIVTGYVPSRSRGWGEHGWCEITVNGTTLVCDPELYYKYPTKNWFMVTYDDAPITYKKN